MSILFPKFLTFVYLAFILALTTAAPRYELMGRNNAYHERSISLQRRELPHKPSTDASRQISIKTAADAAPYVRTPAAGKAMLWSGIQFDKAQAFSKAHGYQTLEQSVGPEILTHPDAHDKTRWVAFWAALSEAYANKVAQSSREVTIVLRAPNKMLTGPSDPLKDGRLYAASDAGTIEIPRMKKANVKIYAIHPDVAGPAGVERYQLWPNDEGYRWQQKHRIGSQGSSVNSASAKPNVSGQKGLEFKPGSGQAIAIRKRMTMEMDEDWARLVSRHLRAQSLF